MKEFAKIEQVQDGTKIIVDDGFTCCQSGEKKVVKKNDKGSLYFDCDEGIHLIDSQRDGNILTGIYLA